MRIFPATPTIGETEGFSPAADIFGRSELGKGLTNLVGSVSEPMVIALDGQWGAGKTTFLKMWAGELRKAGFPVIYFDAFENDYVDDAFAVLAGEITALLERSKKRGEPGAKQFVAKAIGAGKVLARSALKVGVKAATMGALDAADFDDLADAIASEASDLTDKYVGEMITKQAERKATLESFRTALAELPKTLGHQEQEGKDRPLVFIIDELDRCKPLFALAVLERMKHFFAVPNVHFVLGTHLGQMRNTARAVYGSDIDADTYLQKFIGLIFPLVDPARSEHDKSISKYVRKLSAELEFPKDAGRDLELATRFLLTFSNVRELSLRDVERIMSSIALAFAFTEDRTLRPGPVIAGLSILRVLRPALYAKAKMGRLTYEEASEFFGLDSTSRPDQNAYQAWEAGWWEFGLKSDAEPNLVSEFANGLARYNVHSRFDLIPLIANRVVDRLLPYE